MSDRNDIQEAITVLEHHGFTVTAPGESGVDPSVATVIAYLVERIERLERCVCGKARI